MALVSELVSEDRSLPGVSGPVGEVYDRALEIGYFPSVLKASIRNYVLNFTRVSAANRSSSQNERPRFARRHSGPPRLRQ